MSGYDSYDSIICLESHNFPVSLIPNNLVDYSMVFSDKWLQHGRMQFGLSNKYMPYERAIFPVPLTTLPSHAYPFFYPAPFLNVKLQFTSSASSVFLTPSIHLWFTFRQSPSFNVSEANKKYTV